MSQFGEMPGAFDFEVPRIGDAPIKSLGTIRSDHRIIFTGNDQSWGRDLFQNACRRDIILAQIISGDLPVEDQSFAKKLIVVLISALFDLAIGRLDQLVKIPFDFILDYVRR